MNSREETWAKRCPLCKDTIIMNIYGDEEFVHSIEFDVPDKDCCMAIALNIQEQLEKDLGGEEDDDIKFSFNRSSKHIQ